MALAQAQQDAIQEQVEGEDDGEGQVREFNAEASPELPLHLQDFGNMGALRDEDDHDDG